MDIYGNGGYTDDGEDDVSWTIYERQPSTDQPERPEQIFYDCDDELKNMPRYKGLDEEDEALQEFACVMCKTVPYSHVYLCPRRHIMCGGCFHMRKMDKMLRDELGTCPKCKVKLSKRRSKLDVIIENVLSTAIVSCEDCGMCMQRAYLRTHMLEFCPQRRVACKYKRLGCKWTGVFGEAVQEHEKICSCSGKTGLELLEGLQEIQQALNARDELLSKVLRMVQMRGIVTRYVHLLPKHDGFPRNVFVTCTTMPAFRQTWCVEILWQTPDGALLLPSERDCASCKIGFRLVLISFDTYAGPLNLKCTMVSSCFSDVHFRVNLCEFVFNPQKACGPLTVIYKSSWRNCDTLLTERGFYARLVMARV